MWLTPKVNWTATDFYNAEDLNRVENNTIEVSVLIKNVLGIDVGLETTVTNRDYSTIEFEESLNRVESNLAKLSVLSIEGLRPLKTTWMVGDPFDYTDANRYETNLKLLYDILSKNAAIISYAGGFSCGEEVI